jgi:hypothetical protein
VSLQNSKEKEPLQDNASIVLQNTLFILYILLPIFSSFRRDSWLSCACFVSLFGGGKKGEWGSMRALLWASKKKKNLSLLCAAAGHRDHYHNSPGGSLALGYSIPDETGKDKERDRENQLARCPVSLFTFFCLLARLAWAQKTHPLATP